MTIEQDWSGGIRAAAKALWDIEPDGALVEPPSDPKFGDAVCNLPLRLAKRLKQPPRKIAEALAAKLRDAGLPHLEKVEIAGPGFINLTATRSLYAEELGRILSDGADFGRSTRGAGRKVLVEHTSANPTGPLHVAHGRNAAIGDSVANILEFAGYDVGREFYVNDAGNQIAMLGRSVLWRLGDDPEPPDENCYRGEYVKDIAARLGEEGGSIDLERAARFGKDILLEAIRKDLADFRCRFDTWYSQDELEKSGKVEELLNFYASWGLTFEKDGAVWLRTTDHGDAEDKVLVKSDKSYAYRTPDLAYHRDKFARGFDILIDLWGPDHHAHIGTMRAGLRALNYNLVPPDQVGASGGGTPETRPVAFEVLVVQHCRLLQGGKEVKMSKRAASYVTLRELMDEVGVDATRFFFVMRKTNSHLDFDLDVAKKQSMDNPYYYAGYAHARIASIVRKGVGEKQVEAGDVRDGVWGGTYEADRIGEDEIALLRSLRRFERVVEIAARDLDPAAVAEYLRELSGAYQRYYDKGNRDVSKRVLADDEAVRKMRLAVGSATQTVLRNGFRLLGLHPPDRM